MNIGAVTTSSVSAAVWTVAARSLTTLGIFGTETIQIGTTTLAAAASVDLRPAASKHREILVSGVAGAGANTNCGIYDGTTFRAIFQITSGNSGGFLMGNSVQGPRLLNLDGVNSAQYQYTGMDWF